MNVPVRYRTKAEVRLEELESLRRPLTKAESEDLRRCLHAIYMRNWRLTNAVAGSGWEHFDAEREAKREINEIATRMEDATDPDWPKPVPVPVPVHHGLTWQDRARHGSQCLCDAMKLAGVRP